VEGVELTAGRPVRRVLLTGAAGFIGARLARLLIAEGHGITAILTPGGDRTRLAELLPFMRIVECDLSDIGSRAERLRDSRPDVCIHLAWRGGVTGADPRAHLSSLGRSLTLMERLADLGCPRFVSAGTCFEYEPASVPLGENAPLAPHEIYGECKKALFDVAMRFAGTTGLSVAVPRIFYVYGPQEAPQRLVPSTVRALLASEPAKVTPGEQVRDYLHVDDVATAIWTVAQSHVTGSINVASGEAVTIAELTRKIADLVGRPELVELGARPYRSGEPMYLVGDATLLRRMGWTPRYDLHLGLEQTIDWWRAGSTGQETARARPSVTAAGRTTGKGRRT
jgi:nucleoside-diphosphate-sugar epimerase